LIGLELSRSYIFSLEASHLNLEKKKFLFHVQNTGHTYVTSSADGIVLEEFVAPENLPLYARV